MSEKQDPVTITLGEGGTAVEVHCAHTDILPVEQVIPNPKNPNTHPQYQVELLAKILVAQGWRAPITMSRRSGFVVRGHGRLKAAIMAGFEHVPVDYQDYQNEASEWADLVADNRIAELAEIDMDLLRKGLEEFSMDDFDMELSGYSIVELDRLLEQSDFTAANDALAEWDGMPEFEQDKKSFRKIVMHFRNQEDLDEFASIMGQTITDKTKYLWHPAAEDEHARDYRYVVEDDPTEPEAPAEESA